MSEEIVYLSGGPLESRRKVLDVAWAEIVSFPDAPGAEYQRTDELFGGEHVYTYIEQLRGDS